MSHHWSPEEFSSKPRIRGEVGSTAGVAAASVKGCRMPAHHHSTLELGLNSIGQASDKPQGRKPREQDSEAGYTEELWGFGQASVALAVACHS